MKNKFFRWLLFCCTLILSLFAFGACESTDKNEMYMTTDQIAQTTQLNYDSVNDTTRVGFATKLTNNTIYDMEKFAVTFKVFNGNQQVDTVTYHWEQEVKHGFTYESEFYFNINGKITGIEYFSWLAKEAGFWDTYLTFIIVVGIISLILAVLLIILYIATDYSWFIGLFFIVGLGVLPALFRFGWVNFLIGLAGFILVCIAYIIAYNVCDMW